MKRHRTVFLIGLALLALWWTPQGWTEGTAPWVPIVVNEQWGYIDHAGTIVVEPQFDYAWNFSEGLAVVTIGATCGYIDQTGKSAIGFQFDSCESFAEGLAVIGVRIGGMHYGYIDKTGTVVIKPQFGDAQPFSEGLAYVKESLYRPKFDETVPFSEALAAVKASRAADMIVPREGYIDKTGELMIELQPDSGGFDSSDFSEGLALISIDEKFSYIDRTGKIVIEPQFEVAGKFSEGLAAVGNTTFGGLYASAKIGYIDKTGQFVIEPRFGMLSELSDFSEGLALACYGPSEGQCGYIDQHGTFVIKPQFYSALPFSDGLAPVFVGDRETGKWGYIDETGKFLIEPQFDWYAIHHTYGSEYTGKFEEGLAKINLGEQRREEERNIQRWGYIDKTGRVVWAGEQIWRFTR